MLRWLTAIIASSFTFALADVLCDICIGEAEEDNQARTVETAADDDDMSEHDSQGIEMGSLSSDERYDSDGGSLAPMLPLTTREPGDTRYAQVGDVEEKQLSGAQDAAIAGAPAVLARRCLPRTGACRRRRRQLGPACPTLKRLAARSPHRHGDDCWPGGEHALLASLEPGGE